MSDYECPHCGTEYEATGSYEDDYGRHECDTCGCAFFVTIEFEPEYFAEPIAGVSPDEMKRNDVMERGDYLRDRAKDEEQ